MTSAPRAPAPDPPPPAAPLAEVREDLAAALGKRPIVCLTGALVLGVVWSEQVAPAPLVVVLLAATALVAAWLLARAQTRGAEKAILLAVFLLGAGQHAYRIAPGPNDRLPPAGLKLARLQGLVEAVHERNHDQLVVLLQKSQEGAPLRRRVQVSVPPEPSLGLGDTVELSEVRLWPPRAAGTPGEHDEAGELARDGIHCVGRAEHSAVLPGITLTGSLNERLTRLRRHMLERLTVAMPPPHASVHAELLASMVYGMGATTLSRDIKDIFRRSGTIHVLVVSGTQVSLIALSLIFLVRGTRRVLPAWGMVVVILGLVGLALLAGMGASVSRAVAMAVVLLATFACGRQYDFPSALTGSALLLCLLNTGTVFDIGAQLTYACSAGVYLFLPRQVEENRLRRWLHLTWRGTLGAWAFSVPIIAWHFHNVVLLGLVANLIVIPLAVALLYLGLAAIGLSLLSPALATPVCVPAKFLLGIMLKVVGTCAAAPLAMVDNVYPPLPAVLGWYVLVLLIAWIMRSAAPGGLLRRVDHRWTVSGGVALAGLIVLLLCVRQAGNGRLFVEVLDVGAGQCLLVRQGGAAVVVDAGCEPFGQSPSMRIRGEILPFLALRGVRRLDAMIITHPHEDHCNLAAELLRVVPTRQVLAAPALGAEESWTALLQAAAEQSVPVVTLQAGSNLPIGAALLQVLEPTTVLTATDEDANNNSVVLRLDFGGVSMLLPSDLQLEGERRLLWDYQRRPDLLDTDVLVAAHHASIHSNHAGFVAAVTPDVVVVSCGGGARAPKPAALQVFTSRGLPVYRTDQGGTLQIGSDGRRVWVKRYRTQ